MRFDRLFASFAPALLLAASAAVIAGDGMTVTINNNTTSNLLVNVYDLNTNPPQQLLSGESISSFASVSVSLSADGSGRGHLRWTATTAGHDARRCGNKDNPDLNDGDTVHVYANQDCGT
jgi:hypothetical protein